MRRAPGWAWALLALVVLAAAGPAGGGPLPGTRLSEEAIMRKLRAGWHNLRGLQGWQPSDNAHPCRWVHVECDALQRITRIAVSVESAAEARKSAEWLQTLLNPSQGASGANSSGSARSQAPAPPHAGAALLPELAQLQWLEELQLQSYHGRLTGGIPAEWLAPGAFPRLKKLGLEFLNMGAGLPDVPPGVLPRLEELRLDFRELSPSTLPASWGADPRVLPALLALSVHAPLAGPLPAAWAAGFQRLGSFVLVNATWQALVEVAGSGSDRAAGAAGAAAAEPAAGWLRLPPQWASGFKALQLLDLAGVGLRGSIPAAWVEGGFPSLSALSLSAAGLTGTLPPQLFRTHPRLSTLVLTGNQLSGPLPEAWANDTAIDRLVLNDNRLTGPAFPPAWLAPGAMPRLTQLAVMGNPGITGSLPPGLAWPQIQELDLSGTALAGPIPASWCQAPFAAHLGRVEISRTAIDACVPPCASRSLPQLVLNGAYPTQCAEAHRGLSTATVASLATLVPLVAVAVGGRLLWRHKLRRHGPLERRRHETLGLLHQQGEAEGGQVGGAWVGRGKRARLTAMLRAQLGSDRRRGIEMLPIEVLPSGLAHQLGSLQGQEQDAGSEADPGRGPAANGARHGARAWLGEAAAAAPASQPWGAVAPSLRMSVGDLEFSSGPQGQLVELGEGAHAVVYLARLQGVEVAVKVFELQPGLDPHTAWREVSLLRQCAHARIVPLFGVALRGSLLMLAMELMRGGSLRVALQDAELQQRLRWEAGGRQVALDVAEGLHHLHTTQRVMHSDLKSGNVLLSEDLRAFLGDMSVAQVVGSKARSAAGFCCTHAAPEQLMGYRCTLAADMYGFGILLVELTTQCVVDRRGEWRLPRVPDECPQAVLELIEECVVADPLRRCTAAEALRRLEATPEGRTPPSAS